jgi:hypothetical protein
LRRDGYVEWSSFIDALSTQVNWADADYIARQSATVEEILGLAHSNPNILRTRTEEIASNTALLEELAPFMNYPRTLMDKFVLHVDAQDRFRVRLHRFWPRRTAGGAIEKVHYHKWDMSTIILAGEYEERQFQVLESDDELKTATVEEVMRHTLRPGEANSLAWKIPHQVAVHSLDDPCISLFVRGRSRQKFARTFDTANGTFYDTFSPLPQLREGLLQVGQLNGVFHPVMSPVP